MTLLLRLELRQLVRQPLTWIVLALLFVAMLLAAAAGVQRVRAQEATLARIAIEEQQAVARAEDRTRAWSRPADLIVPVFRDPTDAYSYFYKFLTVHAVKLPAPLAAIAAGQSDLQPSHIRLNMSAVFPDTAYELRSPRILSLGAFDLAFVLVYLLPLAVIALAGTTLTREQDSGVLPLIAAQPVAPRSVAAAKFGALVIMLVPLVTGTAIVALLLAGGITAGADVAVLATLVALYTGVWIALSALVASVWRGSVQALATLVLAWAAMTVLIPAAGALLLDAALPAPSRLAYIDRSRALADEVPIGWEHEAGAARFLATRPDLRPADPTAAVASAEAGRLARDAWFRRQLAPQRDAFEAHGRAVDRAGEALRLLSPASLLDSSLQKLARTDMASQLAFTRAADAYAQTLRRHFEPLIVANIGRERPCTACPGRLNFTAYDAVPAFRPDRDDARGVRHGALAIFYLLAVTAIIAIWASRRFRRWPL